MNIQKYSFKGVWIFTLALILSSVLIFFVFIEIDERSETWVRLLKVSTLIPYFLFLIFCIKILRDFPGYHLDEDDLVPVTVVLFMSAILLILNLNWIFSKTRTFPDFFQLLPLPGILFSLYLIAVNVFCKIKR